MAVHDLLAQQTNEMNETNRMNERKK